jgi:hypothetical protein
MIRINDPAMLRKMDRALRQGGNLYTLEDLGYALEEGKMQSHVAKDTWAITAVNDFPNKRTVDVLYVVGSLEGAFALDKDLEKWANGLGADAMTAMGRDGWNRWCSNPGWTKVGTLYSKELDHGRR